MQLSPWGNYYGGVLVDWETKVTIDVFGFPPHAFHPSAVAPLLSPYCNIQTCGFHKAKGICRVDGYALRVASVPASGHLAIQFPTAQGVRNVVFPARIKTYLYNEAPYLGEDDANLFANRSVPTKDEDPAADYDSDVLRERFEDELQDERERNDMEAAHSDTGSSWDSEGNHWHRDYDSGFSLGSTRSGHWI